jgi:biopolymer transport protein ExbD
MDLNRLRSLLAAPLASLFLILVLCTFAAVQKPKSVGMYVPLPKVRSVPFNYCDFLSGRSIVVKLHKDGSYWINETRESPEKLGPRLTEIYGNRAERVVYVLSDPDISFGEFADFYSTIASSTSDLHIVLRTRQFNGDILQCTQGSECGLYWPSHGFSGQCFYPGIQPVKIPRLAGR